MDPSRPSPVRSVGLSIVEVLIALSIISVGILALLSSISTLSSSRNAVDSDIQVQMLVRGIAERIQSENWTTLGSDAPGLTSAPWSVMRCFNVPVHTGPSDTSFNNPPLTQSATAAADNLLSQRFLTHPLPQRNLRVFVEYYRALDIPASATLPAPILSGPGLMDGSVASLTRYASADASISAFRNPSYRTLTRLLSNRPTAIIRPSDPLLIRIMAVWDDDGVDNDADGDGKDDDGRSFTIMTGRKL